MLSLTSIKFGIFFLGLFHSIHPTPHLDTFPTTLNTTTSNTSQGTIIFITIKEDQFITFFYEIPITILTH
ncbi:MAG: hypothetical protein RBT61_09810 [Candidatus Kapabacteria bacterium]|nr:hypothetical protein [Candidatus Kapabacteria bacterium]